MAEKLPKTLYGYIGSDYGRKEDEAYLHTSEEPNDLLQTGESRRVGVWELVGYAEIKNTTTTAVKRLKRKR